MAVSLLRRFAAAGPVPVFAAVGCNAAERVEDLFLDPGLERVSSPRQASVLLVAGEVRAADREMLHRLHDQLPQPRATLWWGAGAPEGIARPVTVPADADPRPAIVDLYRQLVTGARPGEGPLLPDAPPAPWRGRGDHGQGGEGMMGGTPYGRPVPMPPQADLRDGLALDAFTAPLGPFLPPLPPGLVIEPTLQGDVFQRCRVVRPPLPPSDAMRAPFERALREPVPVAAMERARAAHHLRCVARVLAVLELAPWAERCRRAARAAEGGEAVDVEALRGALGRAGAFAAIPDGLGRLDPGVAAGLGGVPLRAAGNAVDARAEQPVYRAHGFRPVVQGGGDVRARLRQWLDEAAQALRLAKALPSGQCTDLGGGVEGPWGPLAADRRQPPLDFAFVDLLPGLEWGEAMLVIASFDAAALSRMAPASREAGPPVHGGGEGA